MRKCFPKHFQNQPADMAVKMFVLGNPGAGKSTLVKSLQTEGAMFSRIKHRFTKVTDVDERTAGIIPYDIESKALGRVTLYDFAGHREFYAGHDALLRNSMTASPSIVVLVIDMRGEEGLIREALQYWFEFINNYSTEGKSESHLVIIGSHVDTLISSSEVKLKLQFLQSITKYHNLDNISIAGEVMLDCRYAESSSMSQLRSFLSHSCQALRIIETMAITHRSFLIFLFDKFRDEPAVKLDVAKQEMIRCADTDHYMYLNCVISSNLIEVCEILNKRGDILFMKNSQHPEISWIVFNQAILLSKVNGVIFAPEEFKEHKNISTSTGVVPLSILASLFPGLDCDMICQFLCYLEFCHEITDPQILVLLQAKTDIYHSDEKFFFFPGLVDLNIRPDVWQLNDQFGYHGGWLLRCSKREQFLTPRFLQVLLIRLAYSLAFVSSSINPSDSDHLSLPRKCYVWKCGICWSDRAGIETIVEVVNQKNVVVLIRSLKRIESQTRLTLVRSQIIKRVLDTKNELCPKVVVKESFLHPKDAISYPLDPNAKVVGMTEVVNAVVEGEFGVLDSDSEGQMVDVESGLLCYEPYLGFQRLILGELFKEDDQALVEDGFLFEIAKCMHKNTDYVVELFKTCPIRPANLMDRAPPGDVHRLVRVFQLWREEMGAEATRYNLRKQLDQFSVFAGRNPLGLCM